MSIHTYMCMVLTRLCLLPVGIEGRLHRRPIWRQAQQQHGVLLECPSKPSAAWRPAHGAFVTSFVVPLGKLRSRSRAAAATGLLSTLKLCGACLLVYLLPSPVSAYLMFCVAAFDPATALHCFACRLNTLPQSMPSRTSEISLPQR